MNGETFLPLLFCFIGPAGSGKSSVCTSLLDRDISVRLSVSSTTRAARHYEKDAREYYFVSENEFKSRVKEGSFLEYAEFADNYYGTEKKNIEKALKEKKHLLLDIEPQGVNQLRSMFPNQVVVVFLCPPSVAQLRKRLEKRAADSKERIDQRLEIAKEEMKIATESDFSDYIIINESLDESIRLAESIVLSEPLRRSRYATDFYEAYLLKSS